MLILILGAVFMLAVSIFIHELGHLLCGMLVGVKARIFSIGYGRGLWKKKIGETVYQITAIPIGGYVLFKGDEYGEGLRGEKGELLSTPPLKRMIPVLGGPFFNFLLGFIILFFLALSGDRAPGNKIFIDESIEESSQAYKAGLRSGDRILRINGKPTETFEDVFTHIGLSAGEQLELEYERNGRMTSVSITPDVYSSGGRPTIGIEPAGDRRVVVTFTYSEQLRNWLTHLLDKENKSGAFFVKRKKILEKNQDQPTTEPAPEKSQETVLKSKAIQYLSDGDVILDVEGNQIHTVSELQKILGLYQGKSVTVQVDRKIYPLLTPWSTEVMKVSAPVNGADVLELFNLKEKEFNEFDVRSFSLASYDPKIKNRLSNIKINGNSFDNFIAVKNYLSNLKTNSIQIEIGELSYLADFKLRPIGLLGFRPSMKFNAEINEKSLSVPEAFVSSAEKVYQNVSTSLIGIKMLFTGLMSPKDNLSGPIGIVHFAGMSLEYGWFTYLDFVARISIALMIMNLLPIPVADGGHLVLYLYEAIAGKPLPRKAIEIIFRAGFAFLLLLGIFVTTNDFLRFL
ncbi:MAG: site-2 protease family protein [Leptospira sp.]|nr:site-2 protease family protein [Leptospira sp.]